MWLAAARIHMVLQWWQIAEPHTKSMLRLGLNSKEIDLLGHDRLRGIRAAAETGSQTNILLGVLDSRTRRLCRCFIRGLVRDSKADPISLLKAAHAAEHDTTPSTTQLLEWER